MRPGELAIVGVVSLAFWFAALVRIRRATRPRAAEPDPAWDGVRPPGSPALAALLVSNWILPRYALTATLLDLVARERVELSISDNEVSVRALPGAALDGQEDLVLTHLTHRGAAQTAPLPALTIGTHDADEKLWIAIGNAVLAEARRLGMSRPRADRWVRWLLRLTVFIPLALLGKASLAPDRPVSAGITLVAIVGLVGWLLGRLVRTLAQPRATDTGDRATAAWAAMAADTIDAASDSDRAYAVAVGGDPGPLGTTFETANRDSVWSNVTGPWRRVTVVERQTDGFMEGRTAIVARAAAVLLSAAFLTMLTWSFTMLVHFGTWSLSTVAVPIAAALFLSGMTAAFWETWPLALDFARRPVHMVGTVVYTEFVQGVGDEVVEHNYVAIDDGTSDEMSLWDVPPSTFRRLHRGAKVRLRRTPRRHGLWSIRTEP